MCGCEIESNWGMQMCTKTFWMCACDDWCVRIGSTILKPVILSY